MQATPGKIVQDITILEAQMQKIQTDLAEMKQKASAGQPIPPAEFALTVIDINELQNLMARQINDGH
jgi:hypothetical protein